MALDHLHIPRKKTWIYNEVLASAAFIDLSGKAPQVYLLLRSKRVPEKFEPKEDQRTGKRGKKQKVPDGWWDRPAVNERDLSLTYKDAKSLGITKRAFTYAIDSLVERGLIDIVDHGGGLEHMSTRYGISERWRKWGKPDFDTCVREKNRNGYCSKIFHERKKDSHDVAK
jgi:hypothetical protein